MSTPLTIPQPNTDRISPARSASSLPGSNSSQINGNDSPRQVQYGSSSSPSHNNDYRSATSYPHQTLPNAFTPYEAQQPIAGPSRPPPSQNFTPRALTPPNYRNVSPSQHADGTSSLSQALQGRRGSAPQANPFPQERSADLPPDSGGHPANSGGPQRKASALVTEWPTSANAAVGTRVGTVNNMQGASKETILKQVLPYPICGSQAD